MCASLDIFLLCAHAEECRLLCEVLTLLGLRAKATKVFVCARALACRVCRLIYGHILLQRVLFCYLIHFAAALFAYPIVLLCS